MEAYDRSTPTLPVGKDAQQVTLTPPKITERILPDVDPNLSIKKEVEVKVETNQGVRGRYDCGECRKSFATGDDRNHHVRTLHGGVRYPCSGCDKLFIKKCHLNRHIKSAHLGEKPYPCTVLW